jgi:hypothetical protein
MTEHPIAIQDIKLSEGLIFRETESARFEAFVFARSQRGLETICREDIPPLSLQLCFNQTVS